MAGAEPGLRPRPLASPGACSIRRRPLGQIGRPVVHQAAPALEQVRPPIGGLDLSSMTHP